MADIFEEFLSFSHEKRVDMGKAAASEIIKECRAAGAPDSDIVAFLCNITKLFVSVDRSCAQGEYELFVDVTGFELKPQQFFDMTNKGGSADFVSYMLDTISKFSKDGREACCVFGLCICSADGEITDAEKAMIARTLH